MPRPIREIVIRFIPQAQQRYDTCGDWQLIDGILKIDVSQMADWRHECAVAIHEAIEAIACTANGITQEAVDAFDMGPGADLDEPGNDPAAPYHAEHMVATEAEKALIAAMGIAWAEYDAAVGDHGERAVGDGEAK